MTAVGYTRANGHIQEAMVTNGHLVCRWSQQYAQMVTSHALNGHK